MIRPAQAMSVEHVEFLVEEPSMKAFLDGLLPSLMGDISFNVYNFEGKGDLLMSLAARLKAYVRWLPETYRIVVVVDRDDDDCRELKERLERMAVEAGLGTPSRPIGSRVAVINRIAVEELESWYFGDWTAVCAAYPDVSPSVPRRSRFRNPDRITGGTWEEFERVMRRAGYFRTGLRKLEAARAIVQYVDPDRNTSRSFQLLRRTIRQLAGQRC